MPETLDARYLEARGFSPSIVRELGGGISNVVLYAETNRGPLVFKQSLAKLRVADEWLFDQRRIWNERRCMEWLSGALPGEAPEVVYADDENFIFGMTFAPPGGRNWKESLLEGDTDPAHAARAGAMLRRMHDRAAADADVRAAFDDINVFLEGRIDPYHRFTAARHPDLAPAIEAEVTRMLSRRVTLVHGDYSPKNLIAYPDRMWMLDFEVAHWGDPAFDVAFCLTHLVLKAIHFRDRRGNYQRVAQAYLEAYAPDSLTAANTIRELGCLLLARIGGKSKEDYVTGEREKNDARTLARRLILEPPATLEFLWQ